jgi:hypothetical protein
MKAQLIRDDMEVSLMSLDGMSALRARAGLGNHAPVSEMIKALHANPVADMEVRLVKRNGAQQAAVFWKNGAIMDYPDSFMLVRMGAAIPADNACAERAGMTPEQMAVAKHAYGRLVAGIMPEDFGLYDAGVVAGYENDGSFKPGPNWDKRHELAADRFPKNSITGDSDDAETARALAGV